MLCAPDCARLLLCARLILCARLLLCALRPQVTPFPAEGTNAGMSKQQRAMRFMRERTLKQELGNRSLLPSSLSSAHPSPCLPTHPDDGGFLMTWQVRRLTRRRRWNCS